MKFRYAVSYEHDLRPVETIRGEVDAVDAAGAVNRGLFRAENARVGRYKFRSLVVCVEQLTASDEKKGQ
jgi:hypothetical protein